MNIIRIFWEGHIEALFYFMPNQPPIRSVYIMSGRHSS